MVKSLSGKVIVKVKGTWHGEVGFHEKYAEDALLRAVPLVVQLKRQGVMTVSPGKLKEAGLHIGQDSYQDKHGGHNYHLAYLPWRPDTKPQPLF
jgi:hypothetical protein